MENKEILQKAIDKAIANGFGLKENFDNEEITVSDQIYKDSFSEGYLLRSTSHNYQFELASIIFSHSFAKVFWGKEIIETGIWLDNDEKQVAIAWQYHLQQLVLCENPLLYIEKFL